MKGKEIVDLIEQAGRCGVYVNRDGTRLMIYSKGFRAASWGAGYYAFTLDAVSAKHWVKVGEL